MKPKKKMHPNSLANLKPPYKPGENGHQHAYPLKERFLHALDHPLKKPKDDDCAGAHLVYSTLEGAILREPTPFKEAWERIEGKVPDKHEIEATVKSISPIEVVIDDHSH